MVQRPGHWEEPDLEHSELDHSLILTSLGVADATVITPVSGGYNTAIWRIDRPNGADALRVFRPSQIESFQRELLTMQVARQCGIPVPEVQATGMWREHPVMLLSWLPGRPLAQELLAHPWRLWPLGVQFGRMQAAIHAVPAPLALQSAGADWIELAGLEETALQERLRSLPSRRASLIHLDYHPLNVLTDGRRITAVLDWTNARFGDPRADIARTFSILCQEPMPARRPAGTPRALVAGAGMAAWLSADGGHARQPEPVLRMGRRYAHPRPVAARRAPGPRFPSVALRAHAPLGGPQQAQGGHRLSTTYMGGIFKTAQSPRRRLARSSAASSERCHLQIFSLWFSGAPTCPTSAHPFS